MLRPGNAGPDTAAEHIEVGPAGAGATAPPAAAAGADPHRFRRRHPDFLTWVTGPGRRLHYSIGMTITEEMHQAILRSQTGSGNPPMTPAARPGPARGSPS